MDQMREWIRRAKEGEKEAKEKLVQENTGLVWSVVRGFAGRGYEMEDLFQIGCIGLMKSIERFDLSYEVKFSTYAVPLISGEIKRFIRDDGMVKVSRKLKENGYKAYRAAQELAHELGRDATIEEIGERCGLPVEDVVMALEANADVESIYKTTYQSDGKEISLIDKIPKEKDEEEEILNHMALHQAMNNLTERERTLILLRYFQNKTQAEIAGVLKISQVQVSRLEKKILKKMRESFDEGQG
ncbi:MAG: SigF/SigG family RNA polymerase sporulation sigma factor [Lachnospiraceae bacterium]|nr:SigF/SigG family RNA polymerase sporulation sigma factor [Lachnospiraceae bacterium]